MINHEGILGSFFKNAFQRGAVTAFLSPPKTCKSFWLMDVAVRAELSGLHVAYFDGHMNKVILLKRHEVRLHAHPFETMNVDDERPMIVKVPVAFDEYGQVVRKEMTWAGPLNIVGQTKVPNGSIRFGTFACGKGKFRDIENAVEESKIDLLVVDPVDDLWSKDGESTRPWEELASFAVKNEVCVVTATIANKFAEQRIGPLELRDAYAKKAMLNHAAFVCGINQNPDEHQNQTMRLNWVKRGDGRPFGMVRVAACLELANPCVIAC